MRKTVAILLGGTSEEHQVSLMSGKNILKSINKDKYNVLIIGIHRDGNWMLYENNDFLINEHDSKLIKLKDNGEPVSILANNQKTLFSLRNMRELNKIDVVFSVLHGTNGEDGNMQGLLNLAGIKFVGPNTLGSAICMDKDITKRVLRESGLPIAEFITLRKNEPYNADDIFSKLGSTVFIKPANQGSSVGVNKANTKESLIKSINQAFLYDNKILIEEYIQGREVECAVLGNETINTSCLGEIIPNHDFYSYEAKYVDSNGAKAEIPCNVSNEVAEEIKLLSKKAFRALNCKGLSRVDFFLTDTKIIINEVNTLPGFTNISMYPMLWQASGLSYVELIDNLIDLALED